VRPFGRSRDALAACGCVLGVALLATCGGDSTGPSRTPAQLAFTVQPNAVVAAGAVIDPVVQVSVLDADGNTARFATASITLAITSGTGVAGATVGGTLTQAAINGVATFGDLTIDRVGAGYTLTATSTDMPGVTSSVFAVIPGAATKLAVTVQPGVVVAGVAIEPAVQVSVLDAGGNTVTSATTSVTLAITSGTGTTGAVLGGTLTQVAVSGVATFSNLTIDRAGAGYTLTARATSLTGATSPAVAVSPGTATQLVFAVQPSAVAVGTAIAPAIQVTVQRAQGSRVTNSTASVTLAITSGTGASGAGLGGTLTVAAVNGVATFSNLTVDKVGAGYTLTATATSLTSATSAAFNNNLAFQSINGGSSHTCGLTAGGAAYCWGGNNEGELGDGTTNNSSIPVAISGGLVFQAISAGSAHNCGLAAGGAAYCWGRNFEGELGDGTAIDRLVPVAVSGGGSLVFKAISSGGAHTCGLTAGGAAHCWGHNYYGELGDGTTSDRLVPVEVSGGLAFQAISAGAFHTCGLTTDGAAYCWGRNWVGQLGDGTVIDRLIPVEVSGGLVLQAISAGSEHSCGLTPGGAAFCWGSNDYSQLGDGTFSDRLSPVSVLGWGLVFKAISVSGGQTCGLTTGGAAYCWGTNEWGQLGDGTTSIRLIPAAVSGGLVFQAISAGSLHTCGTTTGRAAFCWGDNGYGQLGDGTATTRTAPVAVVSP
jgi:alpha-tubulin suppressor-like RCC1 family protein